MSLTDVYRTCSGPSDLFQSTVGDFGRWQFKISFLMALLKFPIAWFQMSIVFIAPPTQFWCKKPTIYGNVSSDKWYELTKPMDERYLMQEGLNSGYCHMRNVENDSKITVPCLYGHDYNRTMFTSSIVTEWNLVCGNERLMDLTQITLMTGVLLGNIFFGIFADRNGRKKALMICIFLQSFFGIVASWVPWYWGFVAARFILGVANGGITVASFVICMEVVGGKWRTIVPILYQIPFGVGYSVMAGLAYGIREWRYLHFAISLLSALYVIYWWLIPESPRWLIVTGRKDEAMVVLQNAAKTNKMNPETVGTVMTDLSNVSNNNNKITFSALFSTSTLRKRTILLCINWLLTGITFYAFNQYLGHVSPNIFLTVSSGGLIAGVGTLLCVYIVGRSGRRWAVATFHILTSVCFLAILAVPQGKFVQDWPRVVFASIGVIGMSISMPALCLFTGELFPTVLRNAGVGAALMFSRIGSMIAPLVISLQDVSWFMPLLLLSIAAFMEAMLVLPLPETNGTTLPETIEDLEMEALNELKRRKNSKKYVTVPTNRPTEYVY